MRARSLSIGLAALIVSIVSGQAIASDQALKDAVAGAQRSSNMAARDRNSMRIAVYMARSMSSGSAEITTTSSHRIRRIWF